MTRPAFQAPSVNGSVHVPPRVFVIDDDPDVLRAMTRLLRSAGHTVEGFASGAEFFKAVRGTECGCLVLDFKMPVANGLEVQAEIVRRGLPLPIVFVTGHGDIPIAVRALKHGAVDFLTKPYRATVLLAAVAGALESGARQQALASQREEVQRRYGRLTPREREVLALIVRGLLNKQIAAALGNSERTVKVHRARLMVKMQARSVPELTRMVDHAGVCPEPAGGAPGGGH